MRVVPFGTAFRLLDDYGTRATVRLRTDSPKGQGPVTVATTSGLAVASVPDDTWLASLCQCLLTFFFPCCAGCAGDDEPDWPWYQLVCDTCPRREAICPHVRAVLQTLPAMRGRVHNSCRRLSAWPTQKVGGTVSNVEDGGRCAVCLDVVADDQASRCGVCTHRFHEGCLRQWVEADARVRCPTCRSAWPISVDWKPLWGLTGSPVQELVAAGCKS